MKKVISLMLALLMLTGMLAACASDDGQSQDTTAAPTVADTTPAPETESPYDANGYLKDSLPADLNFGGEEITTLYWSDVEHQEFFAEEQNGDIVNDAILERNNAVETRLNVKLNYVGTKGNGSNMDNYLTQARNSYQAGDKQYDIYGTYSRTGAKLVINNLAYNLLNVEYLDLEKPWWPDNLMSEAMFDNRLYFVSGDISTMLLHMMYGIFFNKDLFEQRQLTSPYELVEKNEWTYDKLIELGSDVYQDLNNNGSKDNTDFVGMVYDNYQAEAFYAAAGLSFVERDPDKLLIISPDFYGEKTINLLSKLGPWCASDDVMIGNTGMFANAQALFAMNRARYAEQNLRNVDFKYGFVPVPKYDSTQEQFFTCMGNPLSLYLITADCETPDIAAAVLECLASEAYRRTTPAIFETNMKVKYSEGETDSQMYDLIKSSVSFDLGRMFSPDLQYITDIFYKAVNANNTNWSSQTKVYQKILDKQIAGIVADITSIPA